MLSFKKQIFYALLLSAFPIEHIEVRAEHVGGLKLNALKNDDVHLLSIKVCYDENNAEAPDSTSAL